MCVFSGGGGGSSGPTSVSGGATAVQSPTTARGIPLNQNVGGRNATITKNAAELNSTQARQLLANRPTGSRVVQRGDERFLVPGKGQKPFNVSGTQGVLVPPDTPLTPGPPAEAEQALTVAEERARIERRRRAAQLFGLAGTVRTGGLGLTSLASTTTKTLLGQ